MNPIPPLDLTVRPLTPDLFPAIEDLFGPGGARGCWCMYWRIGVAYRQRPVEANRDAFRQVVETEPSPGLLAFAGAICPSAGASLRRVPPSLNSIAHGASDASIKHRSGPYLVSMSAKATASAASPQR
ncbi:MAG TPA: hypothetical protein VHW24_10870 [Bryobacteraceae bacterium]|nr:hypothetical protein [Bryobacteraceae bacterium]